MNRNRFSIRLLMVSIILFAIAVMTGCADVDTQITLNSSNFSGKRVMTVKFDMDELLTRLPGGTDALNEQIDAAIPKQLNYTYNVENDEASYIFTLDFNSKQDYIDKVKNIISKAPEITFSYSSGVFTKGVTYNENFETRELFVWFDKIITENNIATAAQGYSSNKFWNQTGVTVDIDGEQYHCDGGKVSLQTGGKSVVTSISISTMLTAKGDIERTILITIPKNTDKNQLTLIEGFLNDNIPDSGQWTKRSRTDSYIYNIVFTAGSAAKLQSYMDKLTNSTSVCTLDAASDLSQPLAQSKLFSESLNLYYFGGGSPVHVAYRVSSEQGKPYLINIDNGEQERIAETTDDGSYLNCSGDYTNITFKTTLREMAQVKSIEYNLIQYSSNKFVREIVITLADGTHPSVLDSIAEYYQVKGAGNTGVRVNNVEHPSVIITISGKPKQIIAAEAILFGGVGARALGYDSDWGIYRPHPQITVVDSYDITSLITLMGVSKYAYTYCHDGVVITQITGTVQGEQAVENPTSKQSSIRVGLDNGIQTITISAYYFNGWAVFFIIVTVLLIIALITMSVLLYLYKTGRIKIPERRKKTYEPQERESSFSYQPILPTQEPEPEPIPLPEPEPMPLPRDFTVTFDEPEEELPIMLPEPEPESIPLPEPEIEPSFEPVLEIPTVPLNSEPNFEPFVSYPQRYVPTEEFKYNPIPEPEPIPEPQPEPVKLPVVETPPEPVVYNDSTYTDNDLIEDLNALGYLNEYKKRVQKVKVKVRRVKIEMDDED